MNAMRVYWILYDTMISHTTLSLSLLLLGLWWFPTQKWNDLKWFTVASEKTSLSGPWLFPSKSDRKVGASSGPVGWCSQLLYCLARGKKKNILDLVGFSAGENRFVFFVCRRGPNMLKQKSSKVKKKTTCLYLSLNSSHIWCPKNWLNSH